MSSLLDKLPRALRIAGALLLIVGLQAWGFYRQATPLIDRASEQLELLQYEAADHRLANRTLESLQAYWQSNDDELTRRRILEVRDSVLRRFATDPAAAVGELVNVVNGFESRSVGDQDVLVRLQRQARQLEHMYQDHFATAIAAVHRPAWYLLPTAALLNNDDTQFEALLFNHAMYLMHVRDTTSAVEILDDLRTNTTSEILRAKALFTLSRLQYQAFGIEKDQSYFQDALQLAQQSVRADANHALAKLFLDYLLSVDRQAVDVDVSPLEGEGSGEGEGERGAIATDTDDF